ncbi:hypothetical protein BASA62_002342 [Batrachochytrium salamandrivorans]|nr:hypothetical protein BASA62_002342 [Batrachochytrium salamandrivorans]
MRSTDSDRSVRATPKKARDASPPPQDDLWVPDWKSKPVVPQVVVPITRTTLRYHQRVQPPNARLWLPSQTPPPLLHYYYSTTTTGQPSKDTRFADAVKRRPTHQQLVERQPDFRKAGAAAWLALKRETSVPAHSAPKWSSLRVSDSSMQAVSLRKAWRPSKGNAGCPHPYKRIWTRPLSSPFKAWIPRPEAADKDKLAAISSFAAKDGHDHPTQS